MIAAGITLFFAGIIFILVAIRKSRRNELSPLAQIRQARHWLRAAFWLFFFSAILVAISGAPGALAATIFVADLFGVFFTIFV